MAHLTYEQATSKDYERKVLKKLYKKIAYSNWANTQTNGKLVLNCGHIMGSLPFDLNVMCKSYNNQLKHIHNRGEVLDKRNRQFYFNTEEERHNFYDSYFCKFIKWQCSTWVMDTHLVPEYIPFTGDYSKVWSDEDWMDWFELTEDEREFVKLEIYRLKL
ncbi:MAG: hypothetical protein HUJ61_05825 [Bacilli bacterium]|nr:hypothetical protein [Bacilli bacterium]